MNIRPRRYLVVCLLGLAGGPHGLAAGAELSDVAARLDYGYYNEEPAVVRAAFDALERMPETPDVQYHRALAAMRLFELGATERALLEQCIDIAQSLAAAPAWALEGDVLVAACSSLAARSAPMRSMLHQRRRDAALERVLAQAPSHPRALWVAVWGEPLAALDTGQPLSERGIQALELAVAAFRETGGGADGLEWGYAEALAHLGGAYLAAGDARRGRDLLEESLLVAPGYGLALEFLGRLGASP